MMWWIYEHGLAEPLAFLVGALFAVGIMVCIWYASE